jgi:hypothetical protein
MKRLFLSVFLLTVPAIYARMYDVRFRIGGDDSRSMMVTIRDSEYYMSNPMEQERMVDTDREKEMNMHIVLEPIDNDETRVMMNVILEHKDGEKVSRREMMRVGDTIAMQCPITKEEVSIMLEASREDNEEEMRGLMDEADRTMMVN